MNCCSNHGWQILERSMADAFAESIMYGRSGLGRDRVIVEVTSSKGSVSQLLCFCYKT